EVIRGQRRAIMPEEPRTKAIGRFHRVVRKDPPCVRIERWQRFSQIRPRNAVLVLERKTGSEDPGDDLLVDSATQIHATGRGGGLDPAHHDQRMAWPRGSAHLTARAGGSGWAG